jgi:hypothetical protein
MFFVHSIELLVKTADVLGTTEDISSYGRLLEMVKKMFLANYLWEDGSLPETQKAMCRPWSLTSCRTAPGTRGTTPRGADLR